MTQKIALSLKRMQDNKTPVSLGLPQINPYWRECLKHSSCVASHILLSAVTHCEYTAARGKLAAREGEREASARQL